MMRVEYRRLLIGAGLAACLYLVFRFVLPVVLPFVIAFAVGMLLYPLLKRRLENTILWRKRWRKPLFAVVVFLFYGLLFGLLVAGLMYLCGQGKSIGLNLPFYQARCMCGLKNLCGFCDEALHLARGVTFDSVCDMFAGLKTDGLKNAVAKLTSYSVQAVQGTFEMVFQIVVTVISTVFALQEYEQLRDRIRGNDMGRQLAEAVDTCKSALSSYLKAQGTIFLIDGGLCVAAFYLIGKAYPFVWGFCTALVDALPVLGIGLVLLPFCVVLLIKREFGRAGIVFVAYILCICVRQTIEPKMVGSQIGMSPLLTIVSMYVGFRLFGFAGFLLGPVGILTWRKLYACLTCKCGA